MFERSVLVNLLANFLEEAKSSTRVDSKWWRTPELDGCVGHDAETARKAKVGDGADQAKLPGFSRLANVFFLFSCQKPTMRETQTKAPYVLSGTRLAGLAAPQRSTV